MKGSENRNGRAAASEGDDEVALAAGGVSIARFAGFDRAGRFQIDMEGHEGPLSALSTIALMPSDVGARLVVAYENRDRRRPVILGRVQEEGRAGRSGVSVDGDRLVLQAGREVVIRCGESSVTLTKAGKVLIRGAYVLTRSRGINKIKGAFVEIN